MSLFPVVKNVFWTLEDGDNTFVRNVRRHSRNDQQSYIRRRESSETGNWDWRLNSRESRMAVLSSPEASCKSLCS